MRLALAVELLNGGDAARAASILRELERPETLGQLDAKEVELMGRHWVDLGSLADGLRVLEWAALRWPEASSIRILAARLATRQAFDVPSERSERLLAAELHLRAVLADAPGDAGANALLGLVLERRGSLQEAVEAWRCAHALAPEDVEYRTCLAVALCSAGRYREAIPHFERVSASRPRRPDGLLNLGLALRQAGELEASVDAFSRAAELDPSAARPHLEAGVSYRSMGRFEPSIAAFDRAIVIAPRDPEGFHQKAKTLLRLGRLPEAEQMLQLALERSPSRRDLEPTFRDLERRASSTEDDDTIAAATPLGPDLVAEVSSFPIPEIIELLGMGRRTGYLEIEAVGACLELVEGRILSGEVEGHPDMLERLNARGVQMPASVADAELGMGAGALLEAILAEPGTDLSTLEEIVFESCVEAVLAVLDARTGRIEFRSRKLPPTAEGPGLVGLAVDAQGVLLEAFRRMDESRQLESEGGGGSIDLSFL